MALFARIRSRSSLVSLISIFALASLAVAGSLTPSASPAATMNTLAEVYGAIASTSFDSSSITADANGSLIEHLKYIEANLSSGVASDSLDFDEFVDSMTLDAPLSLTAFSSSDDIITIASSSGTEFFAINDNGHINQKGGAIMPRFISETRPGGADGTLNGAFDVFVQGKYAYVANNARDSLAVIDISNPSSPSFMAETQGPTPGTSLDNARAVKVSGRYAYVVSIFRDSLAVIDISNPKSPTFVAELQGTNMDGAVDLAIDGRYAYIANNIGSLAVVDISDPKSPKFVTSTTAGGRLSIAHGITISGHYAYLTTQTGNSLVVMDISNPASPSFVAETLAGGRLGGAKDVKISGRYAYVSAETGGGLVVIDISNPASPSFVSERASIGQPYRFSISGNYIYLANISGDSLVVLDISNPASPSFVTSIQPGGSNGNLDSARAVFVSGRYAYVANSGRDSLAAIDIGSLTAPQVSAGTLETTNLQVYSYATFDNGINVKGGLNIGENALVSGHLSALGSTSFLGKLGIGTTNLDARLEISAINTTQHVASISATSLTSGDVFNITVPSSTSHNGRYFLIKDTNNVTYASLGYGGRLSLARDILSDGATSTCVGPNSPTQGCIDYAESFPTSDTTLSPGELVSIDPTNSQYVIRATQNSSLLGIVSTNPAALIDNNSFKTGSSATPSKNMVPIALAGRVPVKVTGSIQSGDHLTQSDIPGIAKKQTEPGMSVGIALESNAEAPTVMAYVQTGYWAPSTSSLAEASESTYNLSGFDWTIGSIFTALIDLFKQALGIEFGQGRVRVPELCLDDICVGRDQLRGLLDNAGLLPSSPTPTPESTIVPEPESTESPEPMPSETPTETPVPSDAPTPIPLPSDTPTPEPTPEVTPEV